MPQKAHANGGLYPVWFPDEVSEKSPSEKTVTTVVGSASGMDALIAWNGTPLFLPNMLNETKMVRSPSTAAPKSLHPTESIESTAAALFVGRHFVP